MRRPPGRMLVACALASPLLLARAALPAGPWARFDDAAGQRAARPVVASDVPGDAALASFAVNDGMLAVSGRLGLDNGSRWATLGAEIAPTRDDDDKDLGGASVLRIRLASAVARPLRVRIKGGDRDIANAGCYPVVVQMAAATPTDVLIPLSAFRSPAWCGARATTIEDTLRAVERVEVTANDEPTGAVAFSVGAIEFLAAAPPAAGDVSPVDPGRARQPDEPVAAAPAPPAVAQATAAPRRKPAPNAPPAAPPKRVVCEFSARYQLMLCY